MICPNCKIPLSKHDNWCSGCGNYFRADATQNASVVPPPNAPPATPFANSASNTPPPDSNWSQPQPQMAPPPSGGWEGHEKPRRNDRAYVGGAFAGTAGVFLVIRLLLRAALLATHNNYSQDTNDAAENTNTAPPAYSTTAPQSAPAYNTAAQPAWNPPVVRQQPSTPMPFPERPAGYSAVQPGFDRSHFGPHFGSHFSPQGPQVPQAPGVYVPPSAPGQTSVAAPMPDRSVPNVQSPTTAQGLVDAQAQTPSQGQVSGQATTP